jgi:hypothetical protein
VDRWRSMRAAWLDEVETEGVAALRHQLDISDP